MLGLFKYYRGVVGLPGSDYFAGQRRALPFVGYDYRLAGLLAWYLKDTYEGVSTPKECVPVQVPARGIPNTFNFYGPSLSEAKAWAGELDWARELANQNVVYTTGATYNISDFDASWRI